jgi:hypothetical protein
VKLGFLKYVAARKARGDRLFPKMKPDTKEHLSGLWSKWFGRYLDTVVGTDDPSQDFHSFRHTFKARARQAEIYRGNTRRTYRPPKRERGTGISRH